MTGSPDHDWMHPGQVDGQSVDSEWSSLQQPTIAGVRPKEIRPVLTGDGCLTEVWRKDWTLDGQPVDQVFQRLLDPGSINGWHAHVRTTDRLFCGFGKIRLSLYDGRKASSSYNAVWQWIMGAQRPSIVLIPPGVWHAVSVLGDGPAMLLNVVDQAYNYAAPDHRRLPLDSPDIPLRLK